MRVKENGGGHIFRHSASDPTSLGPRPEAPVPVRPTVRRVDPQVDGHWGDAFVGPRDPVGLRFDLLSDLIKVCKLFRLTMQKLGIF